MENDATTQAITKDFKRGLSGGNILQVMSLAYSPGLRFYRPEKLTDVLRDFCKVISANRPTPLDSGRGYHLGETSHETTSSEDILAITETGELSLKQIIASREAHEFDIHQYISAQAKFGVTALLFLRDVGGIYRHAPGIRVSAYVSGLEGTHLQQDRAYNCCLGAFDSMRRPYRLIQTLREPGDEPMWLHHFSLEQCLLLFRSTACALASDLLSQFRNHEGTPYSHRLTERDFHAVHDAAAGGVDTLRYTM
ncbi:MAG: hypothetical protein KGM47_03585 [Acidobacteriota bacterium]|nr:hypothetical protein [Acidobacteriota bacterium]